MVGYHGVSSRAISQRQSGAKGSNVQTGLPNAPARWATAESTVMIKSSSATIVAVTRKFSNRPLKSSNCESDLKWVSSCGGTAACRL